MFTVERHCESVLIVRIRDVGGVGGPNRLNCSNQGIGHRSTPIFTFTLHVDREREIRTRSRDHASFSDLFLSLNFRAY
jgi:hypothetical protein